MKSSLGFTLVEIAVVLVILAFIMSALFFLPLKTWKDHNRITATQQRLEEIKEALLRFAVLNDSLPCPALSAEDGLKSTFCNDDEGYLPWAKLGVGRYDAWGNPFRYRVDDSFTNSPFPDPPDTSSNLVVRDRQKTNLIKADGIIAIIFSCGKNGFPDPTTPSIDLKLSNDADGNRNIKAICTNAGTNDAWYIQDVYVEDTFDDILIWLPKNILINRLAEAGKWPPP